MADTPATHRFSDAALGRVMSMVRKKPGRPSKGLRSPITVRPHPDVKDLAVRRASAMGYDSLSDYVAALMAREMGKPHLAPPPVAKPSEDDRQGRFDLTG